MRLVLPFLLVLVTLWIQERHCDETTDTAKDEVTNQPESTTSFEDETASQPPRRSQAGPKLAFIGYFFVPFFLVVGVTCNIMTIVIMRSSSFRHLPISLVLIALSCSDTLLNVLLPFNKLFVRQLLGYDIRSISNVGCKIFFWAFRSAKMTSSWLVVLISFERFIAVLMPLKAATINTRKNVRIIIASIYIGIGIFNGSWTTFADRIINTTCIPNSPVAALQKLGFIFLVAGLAVYSFIPSIFLIVTTGATCLELLRFRWVRRNMLEEGSQKSKDETGKTTVMLIGVSISFLILVLPVSFGHLVSYIKNVSFFESNDTAFVIYRELSVLLEQANYSINFFLYVVCCASFRKQVLIMLGCGRFAGLIRTKSTASKGNTSGNSNSSKGLQKSVSSIATEKSSVSA